MSIDLHYMRHFVAVAEELHFGRAATRLGMAQPPLSQSIKRLEGMLGFALFERTRRKVELTPGGRVFLVEAHRTLQQADEAVRLARRAASEDLAELSVTFVSAALYRVLPAVLRKHRMRFPNVEIRLDEQPTDAQIRALQNGDADLGFITPPVTSAGLEVALISRDRLIVAVPTPGRFDGRDRVALAELAGEPFVFFPYAQGPVLHGRVMAACRKTGFLPKLAQEARQMHTILSLVAAGLGVSLVPDGARTMHVEGVRFLALTGAPADLTWDLATAWKPRGARHALLSFIQTIRSAGYRPLRV
jgi:DNA-binding transcriptional LysR family regulator